LSGFRTTYCRDPSILDLERGRLELSIGFQCNEARQSVDETSTHQSRVVLAEEVRQTLLIRSAFISPLRDAA
jgi:hypothetical protein